MQNKDIININSIAEVYQMFGLGKPKHDYIGFFRHKQLNIPEGVVFDNLFFSLDMYMISQKDRISGHLQYGRNVYDFQEGTMLFTDLHQVISGYTDFDKNSDDWVLLIHPIFLKFSDLSRKINTFNFFSYEANEALHLSSTEKSIISDIALKIEQEHNNINEKHSVNIIISHLECLLSYSERYYERQFKSRHVSNKTHVVLFEKFLKKYFKKSLAEKGLPTIKDCGKALNISGQYLSDLLKIETGRTAKEHIDLYLIDQAKILLLRTKKNVKEIAYSLGFSYPNHFSKMFKVKTGLTPSEYRKINLKKHIALP